MSERGKHTQSHTLEKNITTKTKIPSSPKTKIIENKISKISNKQETVVVTDTE